MGSGTGEWRETVQFPGDPPPMLPRTHATGSTASGRSGDT